MDGDRILIFPEGLSHDDPFLHPLKTGIARMAIQAVSALSNTIMIQPVIIDYSEKNEFRSELIYSLLRTYDCSKEMIQ